MHPNKQKYKSIVYERASTLSKSYVIDEVDRI